MIVGVNGGSSGFQNYPGGLFNGDDSSVVDHAVALVGWKTVGKDNYWLVRNSWGPTWGENGYMWIKSSANNVGYGAMWITAKTDGTPLRPRPSDLSIQPFVPLFRADFGFDPSGGSKEFPSIRSELMPGT